MRQTLIEWQASLRAVKYAIHVLDGPKPVSARAEQHIEAILRDIEGALSESGLNALSKTENPASDAHNAAALTVSPTHEN